MLSFKNSREGFENNKVSVSFFEEDGDDMAKTNLTEYYKIEKSRPQTATKRQVSSLLRP